MNRISFSVLTAAGWSPCTQIQQLFTFLHSFLGISAAIVKGNTFLQNWPLVLRSSIKWRNDASTVLFAHQTELASAER